MDVSCKDDVTVILLLSVSRIHSASGSNEKEKGNLLKGDFFWIFFFFMYDIQHCFICRPSDSTVSEDAGIDRTQVSWDYGIGSVRGSNHSARSHPHSARSQLQSARSHPHGLDPSNFYFSLESKDKKEFFLF